MTEEQQSNLIVWDRRVSLIFLMGAAVQVVALIVWGANLSSSIAAHEKRIDAIEAVTKPLDGRLARIETLLEIIAGRMDRDEARQGRRAP